MLCSRPNELGQPQTHVREGPPPFKSMVKPTENLGINPSRRVDLPRPKKDKTNKAVERHKQYLKEIQDKRAEERNKEFEALQEKEIKTQKFKKTMEKRRKEIVGPDEDEKFDLGNEDDIDKMI
jgi:hypothetical protein